MNPLTTPTPDTPVVDQDLAEQAKPGHGIPSQDPSPAAQTALPTHETEREAKSVLVGGGMGRTPTENRLWTFVTFAALGALQGVVMELNDCAFPTLNRIVATDEEGNIATSSIASFETNED